MDQFERWIFIVFMSTKSYFNSMRDMIKILFSKAVILTYIFICYSAITSKEVPLCTVDPTPVFSVNDMSYPSAMVIQITSAEHLRPTKESTHYIEILPVRYIEFFVTQISRVSLDAHEPLFLEDSHSGLYQGRAPPSI
jgi:hypothetical protein